LRILDTADGIECYFHKSTTTSLRINEFCFEKGIVLSQLYNKKKRLEEKFFELTND
jgi:hypothetical protein